MSQNKQRYTCVSKPGEYELLGTSSGAGTLKGLPVIVYRDLTNGRLFHREPENFMARMKKTPAEPAINHELLAVLESMVSMMDSGDEPGAGSDWHIEARAAIAKAKGGTE